MDPFSITVGALGITSFALSSIAQLHTLITSVAEAQAVVGDIAANLTNIQRTLSALGELSIADNATSEEVKNVLKKTGMVAAVNECGKACDSFGKSLRKWTKHSTTDHVSLRDRISVGVWN